MVGGRPYDHVMLIDGNDERGIDVGLLTRAAYPIDAMPSHVDDRDTKGNRIFIRDRTSPRLNYFHYCAARMPSSASKKKIVSRGLVTNKQTLNACNSGERST